MAGLSLSIRSRTAFFFFFFFFSSSVIITVIIVVTADLLSQANQIAQLGWPETTGWKDLLASLLIQSDKN